MMTFAGLPGWIWIPACERERPNGGWYVDTVRTGSWRPATTARTWTAAQVVVAAGAYGTQRLLHQMLQRLRAQGLLVPGGRQRTDATCVLSAVRELNRLELVTETLRAALEALAAAAPQWLVALAPEDWYERYGQRASDYRLPQAKPESTEGSCQRREWPDPLRSVRPV